MEVGELYTDDFMSTITENHDIQEFSDYLVNNCIFNNGLFLPHIWATDIISSQRTIKACESFLAKFNKSLASSHSNIFCVYRYFNTIINRYLYFNVEY